MTVDIRPIRTEADYQAALQEISCLMAEDPMPETDEGDRLDVLTTLVQAYEAQHHPVPPPDPIEAIKFRMEQQGLTVADMRPYIGPPHRVYEVLSRKRALSLTMIRRLHSGLGIPAESLIGISRSRP
ncbi:MAG: transcriptional regulator [candidate division NC10 bacterium]|nr:transcriptional regulator [candidate division NC10 bacterium]